MPKQYPSEFRRRVLALVKAGRSVADVAADLDVSPAAIYKWRNQELIDAGLKAGLSTVQSAELVAAHRRIRELEAEVEIMRRASAALKELMPPKGGSR
jgi:transposase